MTSTKLSPGIYEVAAKSRTFSVERAEDGSWQLCEMIGTAAEYWNHFRTKAACLVAIRQELGL